MQELYLCNNTTSSDIKVTWNTCLAFRLQRATGYNLFNLKFKNESECLQVFFSVELRNWQNPKFDILTMQRQRGAVKAGAVQPTLQNKSTMKQAPGVLHPYSQLS